MLSVAKVYWIAFEKLRLIDGKEAWGGKVGEHSKCNSIAKEKIFKASNSRSLDVVFFVYIAVWLAEWRDKGTLETLAKHKLRHRSSTIYSCTCNKVRKEGRMENRGSWTFTSRNEASFTLHTHTQHIQIHTHPRTICMWPQECVSFGALLAIGTFISGVFAFVWPFDNIPVCECVYVFSCCCCIIGLDLRLCDILK